MIDPVSEVAWRGDKLRAIYAEHSGDLRFGLLLDRLGDLHDQKQLDYGRHGDPYANVRGAEEWGIPGWVGAMVRATDKIRRLTKYAKTGELANESVEDSFLDLASYALIGLLLWQEDLDKENT